MRLYTRSGDDGTTGLFGGGRVSKDDPRIEAFGAVDECNAALGVALACPNADPRITDLQGLLLQLGSDLATPAGTPHEDKVRRIGEEDAATLEAWIDEVEAGNEELATFILPGGSPAASHLHMARAVCRRAERRVATLVETDLASPQTLVLLNRASDLLFAMARAANASAGVPDRPWPSNA